LQQESEVIKLEIQLDEKQKREANRKETATSPKEEYREPPKLVN